jgi:hypothetical protein
VETPPSGFWQADARSGEEMKLENSFNVSSIHFRWDLFWFTFSAFTHAAALWIDPQRVASHFEERDHHND